MLCSCRLSSGLIFKHSTIFCFSFLGCFKRFLLSSSFYISQQHVLSCSSFGSFYTSPTSKTTHTTSSYSISFKLRNFCTFILALSLLFLSIKSRPKIRRHILFSSFWIKFSSSTPCNIQSFLLQWSLSPYKRFQPLLRSYFFRSKPSNSFTSIRIVSFTQVLLELCLISLSNFLHIRL